MFSGELNQAQWVLNSYNQKQPRLSRQRSRSCSGLADLELLEKKREKESRHLPIVSNFLRKQVNAKITVTRQRKRHQSERKMKKMASLEEEVLDYCNLDHLDMLGLRSRSYSASVSSLNMTFRDSFRMRSSPSSPTKLHDDNTPKDEIIWVRQKDVTGSSSSLSSTATSHPMSEFEYRYRSLLSSVINPLGAYDSRPGYKPYQLANYLQTVFEIDPSQHELWVKQEQNKKRLNIVLNVTVKEAKNLTVSNTSTDSAALPLEPYCILTVYRPPDSRASPVLPRRVRRSSYTPPAAVQHSSPSRASRKNSAPNLDIQESEAQPQYTKTVQTHANNVTWDEHFEFDVRDVWTEELLIYIWNNDKADSLTEMVKTDAAAKSSGLKSFLKQMRFGVEQAKVTDDFIGQATIPLRDIPATGCCLWFELHRMNKLRKQPAGMLRMGLQLAIKQGPDQCDSAESDQCSLEDYHYIVTKLNRHAAKLQSRSCEDNSHVYNGEPPEESKLILQLFAAQNQLSRLTQALMYLIVILEFIVTSEEPDVEENVLRLAIEKVQQIERDMRQLSPCSSKVDICVPTDYELALLDKCASLYIKQKLDYLAVNMPLFFPTFGDDFEEEFAMTVKSMKMLINLSAWRWGGNYREQLNELITNKIKEDVCRWLNAKIDNLCTRRHVKDMILPNMVAMTSIITETTKFCTTTASYVEYFKKCHVSYYSIVAEVVDEKLSAVCYHMMQELDKYQARYRQFPVNVRDSSKISLKFYLALKKLRYTLQSNLTHSDQCSVDVLKLTAVPSWFHVALISWLQTFRSECFFRVEKALELEEEVIPVTTLVRYSASAVDVLSFFNQICTEWKEIAFECTNNRVMAVTKLTDLICDAARLYADGIYKKFQQKGLDIVTQRCNVMDQFCVMLNNIAHISSYFPDLDQRLEWDTVISALGVESACDDDMTVQVLANQTQKMLHRLTKGASDDLSMRIEFLMRRISDFLSPDMKLYIDVFTSSDDSTTKQDLDPLLQYLDCNLQTLYEKLLSSIYPRMTEEVWHALLRSMEEKLQLGHPPQYYRLVKKYLHSLEDYFVQLGVNHNRMTTLTMESLLTRLDVNSWTTVELQLQYYDHLANCMDTPVDYYGHLAIKAAYVEDLGDKITILIKVLNASNLPVLCVGSRHTKVCVHTELRPSCFFLNTKPQRTRGVDESRCPVFNESIQFSSISASSLPCCGTVLCFTVVDQSLLSESFIGEMFIPLRNLSQVTPTQGLERVAAVMMPLKRPIDPEDGPFQVLKERSNMDKQAKQFISQRLKVINNQPKKRDDADGSNNKHCLPSPFLAFFRGMAEISGCSAEINSP